MTTFTPRTTRWTVAVLAVVAALLVALLVELRHTSALVDRPVVPAPAASIATPTPRRRWPDHGNVPTSRRVRARGAEPGPPALRGVTAECAADGSVVDVGPALAGHRVVLNLWAYWCAPCAAELPAMAEYQRRVGPNVMVVTVHQDENETAALLRLAELGVRLPTLQDGSRRVAAALGVPNVMPATVVLGSDGSVAQTLPRAFANADEIATALGDQTR